MGYRDDEDARRQRVLALETELARARSDHAEVAALERESEDRKETLQKRIGALEQELEEARRDPSAVPDSGRDTPVMPASPKRSVWARVKEAVSWSPLVGVVLGLGTCAYCSVQDCRPSCEAVDDHVALRWAAEVTSASGVNVPVGARCQVKSLFFADRYGEMHIEASEIVVDCNRRVVFDGEGGNGCPVRQARSGERWLYQIPNCSFYGEDGESAQWVGAGLTLSNSSPSWQITLSVAPEARSSESLYDPEEIDARISESIHVAAEVIVLSGRPPVELGAQCEVRVEPADPGSGDDNCTASVRCGDRTLRSSPAECSVREGRPIDARGHGIDVDVSRGTARVYENGPGEPYAASLRLDGPL